VQTALKLRADEVFRDPDSHVGGNPDGDVTLVKFFDYNCAYCRQVAPLLLEAVAADPKLRVVFKEFSILGANSAFAAKAALAARPAGVEAQHPVPDDLKPDAADLGRLGTRRTVIDCRKRQKPPGLRTVFGSPGQTAELRCIKIPA